MKYVILLSLLLSFSAHAQLKFQAQINDDQSVGGSAEKKNDQLFAASLKAVEHFSKELGYDYEEFRKKIEAKFEESFSAFKEQRLNERFGTGKGALTEEQKKEFFSEMEKHRVEEYRKFSRLLETVQAYNLSAPADGKVTVDLTMDRLKLNRLFKRVLSDEKKPYSEIWILSEVTPVNFAWKDLGFEQADTFARPLATSWQKWVSENLPETVEDVSVCDSDCQAFHSEWEQKTVDQLQAGVPQDYQRGLFAKVSFNLRRLQNNTELNENTFEWEGKLLILDIETKRSVATYPLPAERKDWRGLDQKALNSALASRMYRTPLPFFKQMETGLKAVQASRVSRLVIRGHKNISDVLAVVELLKNRGSSLGLEARLDKMKPNEAEVLCFYQGEEKSFTDLLSKLKELKSSTSYQLVNEYTGVQHVLKLVHE